MPRLERLSYHAVDDASTGPDTAATPPSAFRGDVPQGLESLDPTGFNSDPDAARYYLDALLQRDQRPAMRSVLAPAEPENVPGLEMVETRDSPQTQTRLVRFRQSHEAIPVFGSHAVVELTATRDLVSVDCRFGAVRDVPPVPTLDAAQAAHAVEELTGATVSLDSLPPPQLVYFEDDDGKWHLAWHLREVAAAPPEVAEPEPRAGHLPAPSPRDEARVDYLVDAHDGTVLFYYSAAPTLAVTPGVPAVPALLRGVDEAGEGFEFWGIAHGPAFALSDPLRRTKTFDFGFADLSQSRPPPLPEGPVLQPGADWGETHRAAISAHVNAQRVHDFYKSILQRNGVDDSGMDLISVVNCTWAPRGGSREWANAVWYERKMWYGQTAASEGRLVSMSRHLDVIAHELTHGVIEFSSALVYRDESGALNESFCDIFGVVINNWYRAPDRADVATWTWELGAGFRRDGGPLRDLSDPTRTGDPDHYDNRYTGTGDYGGVHTNSGIHNKAAFNLLTARDENGARGFPVEEAAVLLYLCMTRLPPLATLSDARAGLEDVAKTYFAGDPPRRDRKLAAIAAAYDAVGIA